MPGACQRRKRGWQGGFTTGRVDVRDSHDLNYEQPSTLNATGKEELSIKYPSTVTTDAPTLTFGIPSKTKHQHPFLPSSTPPSPPPRKVAAKTSTRTTVAASAGGPQFGVRVEHSSVGHQLDSLTEALIGCYAYLRQGGQLLHPVVFEQFAGAGRGGSGCRDARANQRFRGEREGRALTFFLLSVYLSFDH